MEQTWILEYYRFTADSVLIRRLVISVINQKKKKSRYIFKISCSILSKNHVLWKQFSLFPDCSPNSPQLVVYIGLFQKKIK